jgi:hypothetical protein
MRPDTIVVAGSVAQRPGTGGHTWQFLQYLLGFRRLGWDVLLLDRLEPEMCRDARDQPCPVDASVNLAYLRRVLDGFGLADRFAVLYDRGRRVLGMTRARLLERVRNAALLLNVMGFMDDDEVLAASPRVVFLDTDPGFGQMWQDLGQAFPFRDHDAYVTIGENIGGPDCTIPTLGITWIPTCQPVVLDAWASPTDAVAGPWITGIGAWRGPYDAVEHGGRRYGLRVHEFRKFASLPERAGLPFRLALDIDAADARDIALLDANGWDRVAPADVAGDPWSYRRWIQQSRAEFMVAKGMYVESRSGWFSERSMCYLAAGRPVLAQDTGLDGRYPTGEGLLTFGTVEEAAEAARAVSLDWTRHSRAARAIAADFFDSDRVLVRLLSMVGVA